MLAPSGEGQPSGFRGNALSALALASTRERGDLATAVAAAAWPSKTPQARKLLR
jgi:hypothetical protein